MARKRLGELLVEANVITEGERDIALEHQRRNPIAARLGEILVHLGYIDADRLAWALAEQSGAPLLNLNSVFVDPKILQRFQSARCAVLRVLPVGAVEDVLTVAMADPFDVVAQDEIRGVARMPLRIAVATEDAILKAIQRFFTSEVALDEMVSRLLPNLASPEEIERDQTDPLLQTSLEEYRRDADSRPVLRLVNSIIRDAINLRASDIHLEPMETACLVRYRIDGIMRHMVSLPIFLHPRTVCRIKVMAHMDIAEHRMPQDGRCRVRHQKNEIDLRVSSLPTQHGEKVVIRVLNPRETHIRLDSMGLFADSLTQVERMLRFPQGIILLTGPTGSGKTSTLYAMLHRLKAQNYNIMTLENPIEYDLPGVTQTQTNEKAGMTFSSGFRSILRQDPDVIMVGEIRDAETAEIAFNAAMTGHLVLSTLHTSDACSAPVRLAELGVSPYLLTAALKGVLSQRLLRRLCVHCRQPYRADEETCRRLGASPGEPLVLYRAAGCSRCSNLGYAGRIGVFEILTLSEKMKDMIFEGHFNRGSMADQADKEGMRDLMAHAALHVLGGVTSLEEAMRVVPLEERKGVCPQCQHRVERYFQICPFCSFPLGHNRCRSCDKEQDPSWSLCPYCASRPETQSVREAAPAVAEPRCRSCGMQLKEQWPECPLCLAPAASEVPSPRPAPLPVPLTPARSAARPLLVVVDDPGLLLAIRRAAPEEGFHVSHASTGQDALRRLAAMQPTGLILEADLPGMDGFTLCAQMRDLVSTPIVLLVPPGRPDLEARATRCGAVPMVTDPLDYPRLLSCFSEQESQKLAV